MKQEKGFTLIEVSLVLGIAGLIFVMAFIALPSLWATARDSERRDNVLTFVQKLKDYQTNNNRGALPVFTDETDRNSFNGGTDFVKEIPTSTISAASTDASTTWVGFYRDFMSKEFKDPDGTNYTLSIARCRTPVDTQCNATATPELTDPDINHKLYIVVEATCDGDVPKRSANKRRVAVLYKMERTESAFCANT